MNLPWRESIWVSGLAGILALSGATVAETYSTHVLDDMAALYDLSEEEAADRLASEIVSASQYQLVRELELQGYAGSWYDDSSARLLVATTHSDDRQLLAILDIESVLVHHDLLTLQELAGQLADEFLALGDDESFRSAFVDVMANQAVLVVAPEAQSVAEERLGHLLSDGRAVIRTQVYAVGTSSGNFRAAEGTRNLTWEQNSIHNWPCSIGAATENGFVWAGHCGYQDNEIGDASEIPLGTVTVSTWLNSSEEFDAGKVVTDSGWTPTSTVQGYNHGVFSVNSAMSGLTEYPINSTVCRYGGTSQWAYCGTIDAKNVSLVVSGKFLTGLTQVTAMCSDDGDSGGPHISGGSHMQGVNVGKTREETTCPAILQYVYPTVA